MHAAVRPYLATGVALVGAASIAVMPIQPSNPLLSGPAVPAISSQAFTLTAQTNPIALWASVVTGAVNNVGGLGQDVLSDPAPILRQLLKNQIGYLGTAVGAGKSVVDGVVQYLSPSNPYSLPASIDTALGQLRSGQVAEAFITLSGALISTPIMMILGLPLAGSGLLDVPVKMAQNFADVVATVLSLNTALPLLSSALGPIVGAVDALGGSLQDVVGALGSGRLVDALTAVVNIPAQLTGAILNGYTDVQGVAHPGLLTFSNDAFGGGLLQTLLVTIPRAVAAALGATPATPVAAATADAADAVSTPLAAGAKMVTLTVPGVETSMAAVEVEQVANTSESSSPAVGVDEGSSAESVATEPAPEPEAEAPVTDTDTVDDVSADEPTAGEPEPTAGEAAGPAGGESTDSDPKTDKADLAESLSADAEAGDSDVDGSKVTGAKRGAKGSGSKKDSSAAGDAKDSGAKDSDAKDSDAKGANDGASAAAGSSTAKRDSAGASSSSAE